MTEYEIKKGIPAPTERDPQASYPFSEMEIGDCFDAPIEKFQSVRAIASRRKGVAFVTRQIIDVTPPIVRVWRVK